MLEERWYNLILNTDNEVSLKEVKTALQDLEIDASSVKKGIFDIAYGSSALTIYIIDYEIKFAVLKDDSDMLSFLLTVKDNQKDIFLKSTARLSVRVRNNIQSQGRLVKVVNSYIKTHPTFFEMEYLAKLCPLSSINEFHLVTIEQKAEYVLKKGLIKLEDIRKNSDYLFGDNSGGV